MNIKQTIESLTENGYTCKRAAWGALDASRPNERVTVYFARRCSNGRNAEGVTAHIVPCLDQSQNGKRAREHHAVKLLSRDILRDIPVREIGVATTLFINGEV